MIDLDGLGVNAVSVGGFETCIEVPAWKLCFDIGRCPPTASRLPRVLFTHGHIDHMGGIAHHVGTREMLGMEPPTYYVPAENAEDVEAMLHAWRRLDRSDLHCHVVPVRPGDRFEVGRGKSIVAFRSVHRVPCVGYALVSKRTHLSPALRGMSGAEIARLRAAGEVVSAEEEVVELAFCGDTTVDVLDREPLVQEALRLVLEVTFLDGLVEVENARRHGHVHLDEIVERAHGIRNAALLFTHFSRRYGRDRIVALLDEKLPPDLRARVTPLLPEPPWAD